MQTIEDVVLESPAFADLTDDRRALLAGCGKNARFKDGEYLFREGDSADVFYLLRRGDMALELVAPGRGPLLIETVHTGELVGFSWLFPPHRWHLDGRAVGPVAAIEFDGTCLRGKCEADHEFGYDLQLRFASILIERLQATRLRLLDVYGSPVGVEPA
ncbi:MAG: cyclic nucleotide-binding domain-containing protein [Gaiellaceae bacterium]